jgi:hypothetical protein
VRVYQVGFGREKEKSMQGIKVISHYKKKKLKFFLGQTMPLLGPLAPPPLIIHLFPLCYSENELQPESIVKKSNISNR